VPVYLGGLHSYRGRVKKNAIQSRLYYKKAPNKQFTMALFSLKLASDLPGESANNFIHLVMAFSQAFHDFFAKIIC